MQNIEIHIKYIQKNRLIFFHKLLSSHRTCLCNIKPIQTVQDSNKSTQTSRVPSKDVATKNTDQAMGTAKETPKSSHQATETETENPQNSNGPKESKSSQTSTKCDCAWAIMSDEIAKGTSGSAQVLTVLNKILAEIERLNDQDSTRTRPSVSHPEVDELNNQVQDVREESIENPEISPMPPMRFSRSQMSSFHDIENLSPPLVHSTPKRANIFTRSGNRIEMPAPQLLLEDETLNENSPERNEDNQGSDSEGHWVSMKDSRVNFDLPNPEPETFLTLPVEEPTNSSGNCLII